MFFSINNLLGSFLTILDQQKNLHGKVDKLDKLPYSFLLILFSLCQCSFLSNLEC